jgi:hypothetical protein
MAQVPATEVTLIGDGVTTQFNFTFPYLKDTGVFAEVDGVATPFSYVTASTIEFAEAPADGAEVRIYRNSPGEQLQYEFNLGAPFLPRYVDANNRQLLFVMQEAVNDTQGIANEALTATATFDARMDVLEEVFDPDVNAQLKSDLSNPTDPAKGAAILGRGIVAVDSIADLLAIPESARREDLRYLVKSFYSDLPIEHAFYQYDPTYSKVNHNGGTILDPSHTSAPGQSGWWESTDTGTGCFVMMNADALPLNVLWFGARNDTNMLVPEYDSWGAFDAALRTTFWDHENSKVLINSVRKILTPTRISNRSSTGTALGFYVGKRVTDESAGWPLTAQGVVWTSYDIAQAQTNPIGRMVIFDGGVPITFHNNPIGVMKSPNDYLYRFKWTVAGVYNICVSGSGSTDNYPAVLTNQKIVGDQFFARGVGGNSYASLESVTVEGGRVPYQIYPGVDDRVPGCFVIGVIVDNSAKGTNRSVDGGGIYSNCNASKITNINVMYCIGTSLFLSRSDDSTADANGCHFEFSNNTTATRAAIATINGGGQNKFYIQCAQTNFAAVHLTATAGVNTTRNNIEVGYVGDYADGSTLAPLMFMDVLQTGSVISENVLRSLGNNLPQENPNDLYATPMEIHPLSPALNAILRTNYVTTTESQATGLLAEVVYGLGVAIPLPLFRDYSSNFRNKAGETLPSGAKKVTYTLSDFIGNAPVIEGVWLEVEIWTRGTTSGAGLAVYTKVLCTISGGQPVFVNVAKKESTSPASYDIAVDVVGTELVFYLTAPNSSNIRINLLVKRAIV